MIEKVMFCGEEAYRLENEMLSCICIPQRGGKIASIKYRETGFELLYQNRTSFYSDADVNSKFADFEACGFDDAFPSIDPEMITIDGELIPYPDHGEIWRAAFESEIWADRLLLTYNSELFNYSYIKTFELSGNRLNCTYSIKNNGKKSFPCFFAMHCLVNVEKGMRLIFPNKTDGVINVMDSPKLGKAGTAYRFPKDMICGTEYDFTSLPENESPMMDKYYVNEAVKEGKCGYDYLRSGIRALIEYDCNKLPFLGFWVTQGGFRGEYNCALEPTNGYYDSISCAQKNSKCPVLEPDEAMEFDLSILLEEI